MRAFALLVVLTSGCSLAFMPRADPARPEACKPSRQLPATDIAMGVLYILPAAILTVFSVHHTTCDIDNRCSEHDGNPYLIAPAVTGWGLVVGSFYSAKVGFDRASDCRDLRSQPRVVP